MKGKVGARGTTTARAVIPYMLVSKDDRRGNTRCRELANKALQVIRRFHFVGLNAKSFELIVRSICYAEPNEPNIVSLPVWYGGTWAGMRLIVRHIDPRTGGLETRTFKRVPGIFEEANLEDIPTVDHLCRFVTGASEDEVLQEPEDSDDSDASLITPSAIPQAVLLKHDQNVEKLEKFMRYAAYKLSDMLVSRDGLEEMFEELVLEVGGKTSVKEAYGGDSLFYYQSVSDARSVRYFLGQVPSKDVGGLKRPQIAQVRTLSGVLASIPLDIGLKHFHRSGDPRIAALYLAEAADHVNAEILTGEDGSLACGCDEQMSLALFHHCNSCQRPRVCASLVLHDAAHVCKRCKRKLDSGAQVDTAQAVMESSLRRAHEKECKYLDKDPRSRAERTRLDDMVQKFVGNYLGADRYTDDYATDTPRHVKGVNEVRARREPFTCSVDATEPYGLSDHERSMRVHTASNVAMTTSGYNYLKQRQLLGFLVELSKYSRVATHTQVERDEFERICNDLYIVASKTPWTKKARSQGRDLQDLSADQAEWRAGVPIHDEDGPWNSTLWRWFGREASAIRPYWNAEVIERLSRLVDQIETRYNVRLQRATDGAPWPRKEGSSIQDMPHNWSWTCWASLMEDRLRRMRIFCNRHGVSKF
jgi:hypothetical protein